MEPFNLLYKPVTACTTETNLRVDAMLIIHAVVSFTLFKNQFGNKNRNFNFNTLYKYI
jgi:hypothetical protein